MNRNIIIFLSIVLILNIFLSGCFSQDTLNQGITALKKEDFVTAEKCFKSVLAKNPKDFTARMALAKTYAYSDRLETATEELKKICQIEPNTQHCADAKSFISTIQATKYIIDAREKAANKTIDDVTKGATSCTKLKDQSTVCKFPCDGTLLIKDGLQTMTYADGEQLKDTGNGTYNSSGFSNYSMIKNETLDPMENHFRTVCRTEKDGTQYIERQNGTKQYRYKTGEVKEYLSSGQVLLYTKDDIKILKGPQFNE